MTIPRLAFDLDGTLIDCRPRQLSALRASLGESQVDEDAFWLAKRGGLSTARSLVTVGLTEERAARTATTWTAIVEDDALLTVDEPHDGALAALRHAHAAGFQPIVVTARRRADAVRRQLADWGMEILLGATFVVDPADAARKKASVLRNEGVERFIGDTESDADAASAAGAEFYGVSNGQRSPDFLFRYGVVSLHVDVLAATLAASRVTT